MTQINGGDSSRRRQRPHVKNSPRDSFPHGDSLALRERRVAEQPVESGRARRLCPVWSAEIHHRFPFSGCDHFLGRLGTVPQISRRTLVVGQLEMTVSSPKSDQLRKESGNQLPHSKWITKSRGYAPSGCDGFQSHRRRRCGREIARPRDAKPGRRRRAGPDRAARDTGVAGRRD